MMFEAVKDLIAARTELARETGDLREYAEWSDILFRRLTGDGVVIL